MKGKIFEIGDKKASADCAYILSELVMKRIDPKGIKKYFHDVTGDEKAKAIYDVELTFSACALARGLIEERLRTLCIAHLSSGMEAAPEQQACQPGKASKEQFAKGIELLKAAKLLRRTMKVTNFSSIINYDPDALRFFEEEISEVVSNLALAILAFHVLLFKSNIADLVPEETHQILLEDLQIMHLAFIAIKWNNCSRMGFIFLLIAVDHLKDTLVSIVPDMPKVKDLELELVSNVDFLRTRVRQLLDIPPLEPSVTRVH